MKKLILVIIFVIGITITANSQDVCPAGKVCIPQDTANKLFDTVQQLIAAKDAINKMLIERGASDAAINSALKVIDGWKELDVINNTIIAKQRDVISLYEKVIEMYGKVVDGLEKRLNAPQSAWSKFLGVLKTIAVLATGILLGRGGL